MKRPSAEQVNWARRVLAQECADDDGASVEGCAAAAVRVHDNLNARIARLVGSTGVQALFTRSARLAREQAPCLADIAELVGSDRLGECLRAQTPEVAREAAIILFATFRALITTFIGERLTKEILRSAWPTIEATPPKETDS